jgi:orotate phosphoribosyltransferase
MNANIVDALPARAGHFRLESGYHTDLWLTLDALFVNPRETAPLVTALAARIRPHKVTAICGSLLGGAFLAHALAIELGVEFFFSEPVAPAGAAAMFGVEYRLPDALRARIRGQRVALVDDVISAGSSVRATAVALADAGASIAVVGALFLLGRIGRDHFAARSIPLESLGQRAFTLWDPSNCPLCAAAVALEDPSFVLIQSRYTDP